MVQYRKIKLDLEATLKNIDINNIDYSKIIPVYPASNQIMLGPNYNLEDMKHYQQIKKLDSLIYYDIDFTKKQIKNPEDSNYYGARVFSIIFEPPYNAGWYHLRFSSRTNRVLDFYPSSLQYNLEIGNINLNYETIKRIMRYIKTKLKNLELPDVNQIVNEENCLNNYKLNDQINKAYSSINNTPQTKDEIRLYGILTKLISNFYNLSSSRGAFDYEVKVITPQTSKQETNNYSK